MSKIQMINWIFWLFLVYQIHLKENNIDPKVLGGTRVDSLRRHYNKEWLPRHVGIPERRTVTTNEAYSTKLEHEIEYLRQEVEALKKILQADSEAKSIKD